METIHKIPDLAKFGNVVPEGYSYYEKVVTTGEDLVMPGAYLKWYDLYPEDAPISSHQSSEAGEFLKNQIESGKLKLNGELGFVILHRAGSVLLLLVTVWRNTNEMWEVVYMKSAIEQDSYREITFDSIPRATYCVWELGPAWHERNAWVNFLSSKRDDAAKVQYINDRFEGRV